AGPDPAGRQGRGPAAGGLSVAVRTRKLTEAAFTRQVLEMAAAFGWMSLHIRPARTRRGWRTPVQGHGKGFPDLLLLRGARLLVAELKPGRRRPTPEQAAWLTAFGLAGVEWYVWNEKSWDEIERVLR